MTSLRERLRGTEHTLEAELRGALGRVHHVESELADTRRALEHLDHSRPVPRIGVDYSFARPSPWALRRAGVHFVVRYLGGGGKGLTRGEAEHLSAAGLELAVVFEQSGRIEGYDAGARDALAAERLAKSAGVPSSRAIYFACDFDAAGEHRLEPVAEYVRGAVHAIGWARVGLYAGFGMIEHAAAEHRCRFYWQTLAWSGGRWSSHAQVRQTRIEVPVAGARCDIDLAVTADFGQWRIG